MSTRKFSFLKLHKLLRVLVITIVLLSAIVLAFSLYMYNFKAEKIWDSNIVACDKTFGETKYESWSVDSYARCVRSGDAWGFYLKISVVSGALVFFLPIAFFGSTWLIKYLFPVKKDEAGTN